MPKLFNTNGRQTLPKTNKDTEKSVSSELYGDVAEHFKISGTMDNKAIYALANGINPNALDEKMFQNFRSIDSVASDLAKQFTDIKKMPEPQQKEAYTKYFKKVKEHNEQRASLNKSLGDGKLMRDNTSWQTGLLQHDKSTFDLTFTAPKSVAMAAVAGGDKEVLNAYHEAVAETMNFVQKNLTTTQSSAAGHPPKNSEGLVAVKNDVMLHDDHGSKVSPTLETKFSIFSLTLDKNGEAQKLNQEEIAKHGPLIEQLFQNTLANKIEKLEYATKWDRQQGGNYTFEIKGIEIMSVDQSHPVPDPRNQKSISEFFSRSVEKETGRSMSDMLIAAKELKPDQTIASTPKEAIVEAVKSLDSQKTVYTTFDLLHETARISQGKFATTDLQIAQSINNKNDRGSMLLSTDMMAIGETHNAKNQILASKDILRSEANILTFMDKGKSFGALMTDAEFNDAYAKTSKELGGEYSLTTDQKSALHHILTTPGQLIGIQGDAGTGKTTMAKYLHDMTIGSTTIYGMSTTGKAAAELESKTRISTTTVDSFVYSYQDSDRTNNTPSIMLVDEASMVGTKRLDDVSKIADKFSAKVVLIGDRNQIKLEHGHMFQTLQDNGMPTVSMTETVRFKTDLTKEVSSAMKDINTVAAGLDRLESAGRLITNLPDLKGEFARNLAHDILNKGIFSATGIANSNSDRIELNDMVRDIIKKSGGLKDGVKMKVLESKRLAGADIKIVSNYKPGDVIIPNREEHSNLLPNKRYEILNVYRDTNEIGVRKNLEGGAFAEIKVKGEDLPKFGAYSREEREFAKGDKIQFDKNWLMEGVMNGHTAVITAIDPKKNMITAENEKGGQIEFKLKNYDFISHGFVSTLTKFQGGDAENMHIYADVNSRLNSHSAAYVAGSRAIKDLTVYTQDRDKLEEKYTESHIVKNASDFLPHEKIKEHAEVAKVSANAMSISSNINKSVEPRDVDIDLSVGTEKHARIREALSATLNLTRVNQLKNMENKLFEHGILAMDKSRHHAIEFGYYNKTFEKSVQRMEKRLDQLVRDGYVTKSPHDSSIYVLKNDKKEDFKNGMKTFTAAAERYLIADSFSENFKNDFESINANKAFVGRKYGHGIEAELNAGVDKILNEALAGTMALISATTKFTANKVLSAVIGSVKEGMSVIKALKAYNPEKEDFKTFISNMPKDAAKELDPIDSQMGRGALEEEYQHRR